MLNLTSVAPLLSKQGIYGPVTATLDWCESNHQWSPYIAEMANTFSNLFTVVIAVCGAKVAREQGLPTRYLFGYFGVILVGLGSFLFHATLLFEAQLADELPMIYVGSTSLWIMFDTEPGFGFSRTRTRLLSVLLIAFDVFFSWSYIRWRNPIYHQVVFGLTVVITALRVAYLLRADDNKRPIPEKKKNEIARFFGTGAAMFAFGFLVWNLDNVLCHHLVQLKVKIGWPLAFLLEGHSWWHILTGLGTYYMFIGNQYVTLCKKDKPENYSIMHRYMLPHVRRHQAGDKKEQ